jgi:hypothetical protein
MLAAACGQLGEREAAAKAIPELLHLRPSLGQTVRQEFKKWWDHEYVESVIDGLRKAGLEIAVEPSSPEANLVGIIESNSRHRHES